MNEHIKIFLEQNPNYLNIKDAKPDVQETIKWAYNTNKVSIVKFDKEYFYTLEDLECALMWKEKDNKGIK